MSGKKTIEEILSSDGKYVSTTVGFSMKPLFHDRRDTIIILPKSSRLKKYDVPLYRVGESYILHRIIKVLPDSYVIRGDNCKDKEFGISDEQIIGVLHSFYRKDKYGEVSSLGYRVYSVLIVAAHPFIWACRRVRSCVSRLLKRK